MRVSLVRPGSSGHSASRRRARSWHAGLAAGTAFLLGLGLGTASGQGFRVADTDWQGTSELYALAQRALGKERVEVVATLDYDKLTRQDGVLMLHPELELDYDELSAFLRAGGRLGLLDDRGSGARFLVRFQIQRVEAPLRPAHTLRNNPNLAIAIPAVEQVAGQEQNRHPVVADVDHVVTNHPTALIHPNLTTVLKIPALGEPDATLAATGIIANRGRLFAMGDPSTLINLMLRYPGNRAFANGLVKYLVENDASFTRQGKLYLVANDFRQKGHFGGHRGSLAELLSARDALLEYLAELGKNGLPATLALLLGVLAALGSVGWALRHTARSYNPGVPRYARPVPLVAQGGLAGRAAVLAAPTTDPVLVLIELQSALIEGLAARLGLGALSSAEQVSEEIKRQGVLEPRQQGELKRLFRELSRAQSAFLAGKRRRTKPALVEETRRKVMEILGEIEQRSGVIP